MAQPTPKLTLKNIITTLTSADRDQFERKRLRLYQLKFWLADARSDVVSLRDAKLIFAALSVSEEVRNEIRHAKAAENQQPTPTSAFSDLIDDDDFAESLNELFKKPDGIYRLVRSSQLPIPTPSSRRKVESLNRLTELTLRAHITNEVAPKTFALDLYLCEAAAPGSKMIKEMRQNVPSVVIAPHSCTPQPRSLMTLDRLTSNANVSGAH